MKSKVIARSFAIRGRCLAVAAILALLGGAQAWAESSGPQVATATTEALLDPTPGLSVFWRGKTVSALPFRVRLLNQSSPLAYSLDIQRPAAYGDSWTAISLGRPAHSEDRSPSSIGVNDPLLAEAIARGDVQANKPSSLAATNFELAARQVAIWSATNHLPLTRHAVRNAQLRRRAKQLLMGAQDIRVPLQAAYHSVQVFVRETTGNRVRLAVVIGLDPNTESATAQNIDLYLDGVRCPVRTQALTRIHKNGDGSYRAGQPEPLARMTHSTDIAEVDLDRNTKVVDVTATWVNVISDPGLVMVSNSAAPPLLTAEPSALNFTSTTQLDPSDYANPAQLLGNLGTATLTTLPEWLVLVVILLALYLLPRVGRTIDWLFRALRRRLQTPDVQPTHVAPLSVHVQAPSQAEAVRAGLAALNLTSVTDLDITVVQPARHRLLTRVTPLRSA